jgi:hypothetical protein
MSDEPDEAKAAERRARVVTATAELAGTGQVTVAAYDSDLVLWAAEQAALLRARKFDALDIENLAQEVEDLAKSQRRELTGRVRTILEHMIKLEISPANYPRFDWNDTIRREREDTKDLLDDNPSLTREVGGIIHRQIPAAQRRAAASLKDHGEQPRSGAVSQTYTPEMVLPFLGGEGA